ncbi:unnamed protein product [Chrysodeixis includens]|uniref:C2H2-type domain-containing protein n=1 Tax=Chrysodeixis includens TaxID=689277 RepID=A0A9N8PYG5_CHRIL|nr:unnamed protein product [Chrysodeixis includens]
MTLFWKRYSVVPLDGARGHLSAVESVPREPRSTPPLAISLAVEEGAGSGSDLVTAHGGDPASWWGCDASDGQVCALPSWSQSSPVRSGAAVVGHWDVGIRGVVVTQVGQYFLFFSRFGGEEWRVTTMCDMQKMPSREDASCEEDSDMNFATFSAVGAPGTHFVTTGGQLPVTKIQQNVSNNGTGMQQVCVAMGDGGVQYMRALDGGATIQATPQLISVPIALPGAKPGDPQPTVQIQVLNPNLLQAQQQPKYQMQIPIQGFQQGGAVLTLAYSPENEAGGIQLVGQGSLGEGLQVLATLPHEMQLVQPTQEKDHMQNMHQVFITPNQQIIINGPENKTLNNNTSSDNNNEAMEIIIKEECDETTNDDESSQGTETSDSVQWQRQLGTSHQQDLVKYLNTLPPQQTQALPASLQQFLRKNPTDVKSEPVEIDIDMDEVVTDDKKEEPVAEAVLSEGLHLNSSSEQQRSKLNLRDNVNVKNQESNTKRKSLKDNFPKMKSTASKDYSAKKDVSTASHIGIQSTKFSIAELSNRTIDKSIAKFGPVKNQPSKPPTEVFSVPTTPLSNKRRKIRSVSPSIPYETIDLVTDDDSETDSIPKAVKTLPKVVSEQNTSQKTEKTPNNTPNQPVKHSIEPIIQFLPVLEKPPINALPVLVNATPKSVSLKSRTSTPLKYIANKSVKPLAQVEPRMKESCDPTENNSVKSKKVQSRIYWPQTPKKPRAQVKVSEVIKETTKKASLKDSSKLNKQLQSPKVSPVTSETNKTTESSPKTFLLVTNKSQESSKYSLISCPSNYIIQPLKIPCLVTKPTKQMEKKIVNSLPPKTAETLSTKQIADCSSKILLITSKTPPNPESQGPPVSGDFSSAPDGVPTAGTVTSVTYPLHHAMEPLPDTQSVTNNLFQNANVASNEFPLETIDTLPLSETFSVSNDTFEQSGNNVESFSSYQPIQIVSNGPTMEQPNVSLQVIPSHDYQLTTTDKTQGATEVYPLFQTLEPETFAVENDSLKQTSESATVQQFVMIGPSLVTDGSFVQNETYTPYQTSESIPQVVSVENKSFVISENNQVPQNMEFKIIEPDDALANATYEFTEIPPDVYESQYGPGDANDSYSPADNTTVTNDPSNFPSYKNVEHFIEIPPEVDINQSVGSISVPSVIYHTYTNNEQTQGNIVINTSYDATDGPSSSCQTLPEHIQPSNISRDVGTYPTFQIIEPAAASAEPLVENQRVNYIKVLSGNYAPDETLGSFANNATSHNMVESANAYPPHESVGSTPQVQNKCETTKQITGYKEYEDVEMAEEQSSKYQQYEVVQQLTVYDTGQQPTDFQPNTNQPRGPGEQMIIEQPTTFQTIQNPPELQSSTIQQHSAVQLIEQPLTTNQLYETVEQLSDQYEIVQNTAEQSITDQQYGTNPQHVAQPLAQTQFYETELQEQYETVQSSPEQSITDQQYETGPQHVTQALSTTQMFETVGQLQEQLVTEQQYEMSPQHVAQSLTTTELYETVKQLQEQYESVQSTSEQTITDQQYETGPQQVAQPLSTTQMYETVEQLQVQYEPLQNTPEQSVTDEQYQMNPQLLAEPLAANQLYDTVNQLAEKYQQYRENVQNLAEQSLPTNEAYESAKKFIELQPATSGYYEAMIDYITEQLAINQQHETFRQQTELQRNTNLINETLEKYEAAPYQPYETVAPSFNVQRDSNINCPIFPLNDLLPLTHRSYDLIEPLKPLTDIRLGNTSQDVVEPVTERTEAPTYQSFGPLTEVFSVHYPQYENVAPLSEIYPLHKTTGLLTHDIAAKNNLEGIFENVELPPYYENHGTVEPVVTYQATSDQSYGGSEYFTEIPPPPDYFKEEEPEASWTNTLPLDNINSNSVNDDNNMLYQNSDTEAKTVIAYAAVESVPFGTVEPLINGSKATMTSPRKAEPCIRVPVITSTAYNKTLSQPEVAPQYQALNVQTEIVPILSPAYAEPLGTNHLLVSNPDQQTNPQLPKIILVSYKLSQPERKNILDVNNKPKNASPDNGISKPKTELKTNKNTKKIKAKTLKPKKVSQPVKTEKESKPYVYKPKKKKINPKMKVFKNRTPSLETIKSTPLIPSTDILPKVEQSNSTYEAQRLQSVLETLKSEAECLNKNGTLRIQSKKKKKYKKKPPKPARPKPGQVVIATAVDGSPIFCCPECQMAYPEKEQLEIHLVVHKIERRFICGICGAGLSRYFTIVASFYRKDHLRKHTRSHESKRARDEANGDVAPAQPPPTTANIIPEITIHIPTSSSNQPPVQINFPQHVVTSLSQAEATSLDALLAHHS